MISPITLILRDERCCCILSSFEDGTKRYRPSSASTQKYRALAPQIRSQALYFFVFRLRSQQELDALLDEVSALGGRKTVESFYREATKKP